MTEATYIGEELELFGQARRWKGYLVSEIAPFLGARVLEVGAGIGGMARAFARSSWSEWTCLEQDPASVRRIADLIARGDLPSRCAVRCGTIGDLPAGETFDSVLYIDVLEHIEDDARELRDAAARLAVGGHLAVMSPAHPWLFSAFDAAIGHYRRYTKGSLRAAAPPHLELVHLRYLDAVGMLASTANRVLLKQGTPTLREILLWDRVMVRASTHLDPLIGYRIGKSVLGIWRRAA
jgi:2-polyprenyl-3-methyl-5-hydroxy-6-metoxy-1,4-benzoquinol methylase